MFSRLFRRTKKTDPVFAYAQLNARVMPMERGALFEDPLHEAIDKKGYGEVTGAGTMQSPTGEIEYCGIDLDLYDLENGPAFVCKFLTDRGAPRGSKLEYERDGQKIAVPFGAAEGLAIYLNGTDLPPEVYQQCDVNEFIDVVNKRLDAAGAGAILGSWEGPTETALYMYGRSASGMRKAIGPYVAEYPLSQRARLVEIA